MGASITVLRFTLGISSIDDMRRKARDARNYPVLKIKLGTPDDMPRLEAVRAGAPKSTIIVDANEGWTAEVYSDLAPHLVRLGVELVEQPLPAGEDDMLAEIERPLPVCADESAHDRASLPRLNPPVSTSARTSGSACPARSAAAIRPATSSFSALRFSSRFSVIVWTWSRTSTSTRSDEAGGIAGLLGLSASRGAAQDPDGSLLRKTQ